MRFDSIIIVSSSKYPAEIQSFTQFCVEFHISKKARIIYSVEDTLIESSGNVIFANFRAVRELVYSINSVRGVLGNADKEVRTGFVNAIGLLDEISHFLVRVYDEQENPGVMERAYKHLELSLGKETLEKTLMQFLSEFPPKSVYQNLQTEEAYLNSFTSNRPHKVIAMEELVMLHLSNFNPANKKIKELFDDTNLVATTKYRAVIKELEQFFVGEKPFGPDNQVLFDALKKPIMEHPESVEAQLAFLKDRWGIILTSLFHDRINSSFDLSNEEEKFIWHTFNQFKGTPNVETFVPEYKKGQKVTPEQQRELLRRGMTKPEDYIYAEPEQFTPDTDWMPNVVLIAKNIYVWLDQLSKKYRQEIKRLDQIPDKELDQLAGWNFTGLWLIGIWERSPSSKRIKQIMGNTDAVSSAYSLYDYEIARDLGGEESFKNLNHRCLERGIRLAGDMVPNHMGLYSKWVIEHPEYFIQTVHPPYPNYSFTGENLSHDQNIDLRIEDGYWTHRDAAVVFQRMDRRNGEIRYLYHGNDGTSMPWNDTAQLNLLRADVREAVIQNILHVARKFSVIRFDAAMTLAKKHFQRLWYPMPGTSGVPSRQDHSLLRHEFEAMFPNEFWREVVDRINIEMPQTLLLAEAFWLMEGYFVRTLGMHRVYNSAFMHMLMKEENQKFRAMIKNTLEFNPEILKRYVNFMSNPDEQTAIEQFGSDDKYFGVATLMITLPGLPMFAHGQIEGFKEKYGMEYQRAYYNETPDDWLVRRHELEIFPLTKKRYLFSQVHNFEFYDFLDDRGFVNEDVIVYSNRAGNERAIIFFHNKFADCKGYINHSLPKAVNEEGSVRSITIGQSLQFKSIQNIYYRYRNRTSNQEYLISGQDLIDRGMRIELHAFEYAVFSEFQEIADETGDYRSIAHRLHGSGTDQLDTLLKNERLHPFHQSIERAYRDFTFDRFLAQYENIVTALSKTLGKPIDSARFTKSVTHYWECVQRYLDDMNKEQKPPKKTSKIRQSVFNNHVWEVRLALFTFIQECHSIMNESEMRRNTVDIFAELQIDSVIKNVLIQNGETEVSANHTKNMLKNVVRLHKALDTLTEAPSFVDLVFNDFESADFIGVHQYHDEWYFNKEQYESLMQWLVILCSIRKRELDDDNKNFGTDYHIFNRLTEVSQESDYRVEKLKELILKRPSAKKGVKKGMGNRVQKSESKVNNKGKGTKKLESKGKKKGAKSGKSPKSKVKSSPKKRKKKPTR